ncbi:hypothetical protein ACIRJR_16950 [Streptomyces sp. NPDC102402]|uniref:hypothetical protein n=1 Tax=Streptomyces sp. NPDC102402 TaxID=3366169 RepID=UPI0037F7E1F8
MARTVVWFLACAGFGVVLWLLTSAPDISSSYPHSECHAVLGSDGRGAGYGLMEDGVDAKCASLHTRRLGWAVLVSVPTVVLAAAGMRRQGS